MAARGARSKKDVDKNIKKQDAKLAAKDHGPDNSSISKYSISSSIFKGALNQPYPSAGPGRYSPSLQSIGSGDFQHGTPSSAGSETKQKKKYVANGKETRAPRGRGGGVPTRKTEAGREAPNISDYPRAQLKSRASDYSYSHRNATSREQSDPWSRFKVFLGPRQCAPYQGLVNETYLWDSTGDCTVHFVEESGIVDPLPHLRIHVSVLQASGSIFLKNLVRYGELPGDEMEHEIRGYGDGHDFSVGRNPENFHSSRLGLNFLDDDVFQALPERPAPAEYGPGSPLKRKQRLSSPLSNHLRAEQQQSSESRGISNSTLSTTTSYDQNRTPRDENAVTHDIWFRAPSHIGSPSIQRRHHIATRNFIALLYGKPMVGADLFEMLSDLQNVMDTYYELNEADTRRDSARDLVEYLSEWRLDDVRNDLQSALHLLAWCELPNVRWKEGYVEAFVHCVGMMTPSAMASPAFKNLSRVTRHNLETAHSDLQLRIYNAEEGLSKFDFPVLWSSKSVIPDNPYKRAFDAFREFLTSFYCSQYCSWPPKMKEGQHWLTRKLVRDLQEDFGCIYDLLVDREIVGDESEARPNRKWEIISDIPGSDFRADNDDLPLTDMLAAFDSQHKFLHIPHPFPLLPHLEHAAKTTAREPKKNFLGKFKKVMAVQKDQRETLQVSLAFSGATNINRPGMFTEDNRLIDPLKDHEKSLDINHFPPVAARLGRWILLYGSLQFLATLSEDTEGVKHTADVQYFLCPDLQGCPPWQSYSISHPVADRFIQWNQTRSYCWRAPDRWNGGNEPPTYDADSAMRFQQRQSSKFNLMSTVPEERSDDTLDALDARDVASRDQVNCNQRQNTHSAHVASPARDGVDDDNHGNAIGVALFPDIRHLSLAEKTGGSDIRDWASKPGFNHLQNHPAMRSLPNMPRHSPIGQMSPVYGGRDNLHRDWNRSGHLQRS